MTMTSRSDLSDHERRTFDDKGCPRCGGPIEVPPADLAAHGDVYCSTCRGSGKCVWWYYELRIINGLPIDGCKHEKVIPSGNGMGQCVDCGDDSFPLEDDRPAPTVPYFDASTTRCEHVTSFFKHPTSRGSKGWRCGQPAGHDGEHRSYSPLGAPWSPRPGGLGVLGGGPPVKCGCCGLPIVFACAVCSSGLHDPEGCECSCKAFPRPRKLPTQLEIGNMRGRMMVITIDGDRIFEVHPEAIHELIEAIDIHCAPGGTNAPFRINLVTGKVTGL